MITLIQTVRTLKGHSTVKENRNKISKKLREHKKHEKKKLN